MNDVKEIFALLLDCLNGKEPHWFIKILIGLIVGLILPYIIRALNWPFLFFKKHVLRRLWWEYHYSTIDNEDKVYEGALRIRSGLSGSLVFRMVQEDSKLKYRGRVTCELGSDQFVLIGKSTDKSNEEHMLWRFHYPIKSKAERIITGVVASYNHDKKPYVAIAILTKDRIGTDEASLVLKKAQVDTDGLPLLKVRKSVS